MAKIYDFANLRPEPRYPTYPSYHKGPYLEDYVFEHYKKNREAFDATGRIMLPVSWTSLYVDGTSHNIQEYLDALPRDKAYWTLSQHDDGIRHRLPPNTLHFGAGGLGGGIPIPLICSAFPQDMHCIDHSKIYLCSFVGSSTHPIRKQLEDYHDSEFQKHGFTKYKTSFSTGQWNQTIEPDKLWRFITNTRRSHFALAPRGYGLTSFRLYEIMQLGSIPVYVSDKHWLPWEDELDWNEFCVIIKPEQISDLYNILNDISPEKREQMLAKGKEVHSKYFTMDGLCSNILKRLS